MKKIEVIIGKTWYFIVWLFLCIAIAIFALKPHVPEMVIILGIVVLLLIHFGTKQCSSINENYIKIKIWIATFVSRYSFCCFINDKIQQQNDFAITLEEANIGIFVDRLDYYRQWVHKMIYPLLLHKFGFNTQPKIFLVQSIIVAFVAVMIYIIASKIVNNRMAFYASCLYVLWPGQLFYSAIITEEHVAALVVCFLIIGSLKMYDLLEEGFSTKKEMYQYVLLVILLGILFGMSEFFKDWGSVILVTIVISGVWIIVHVSNKKRLFFLIGLLTIIVFRSIIASLVINYCENRLGGVSVGNNVVVSQMYGTLDPNSTGEYNGEANEEYLNIVKKYNYDFDAANKEALSILKNKIVQDIDKMPALLYRKGTTAYVDDASMLYWVFVVSNISEENYSYYRAIIQILWYLSALYYIFMAISLMIGMSFKTSNKKFYIGLIILGSIFVSLIIESHGRYKYSIEPLWCIVACQIFDSDLHDKFVFGLRNICNRLKVRI